MNSKLCPVSSQQRSVLCCEHLLLHKPMSLSSNVGNWKLDELCCEKDQSPVIRPVPPGLCDSAQRSEAGGPTPQHLYSPHLGGGGPSDLNGRSFPDSPKRQRAGHCSCFCSSRGCDPSPPALPLLLSFVGEMCGWHTACVGCSLWLSGSGIQLDVIYGRADRERSDAGLPVLAVSGR